MEHDQAIGEAGHGAEHGGGLPQLDFDTWPSQIFWLIVAFAALYFILSRIALPKIAETLQARQDQIAGDLDLAAEFEQKAKEAEQAFERALEEARAEARAIADKKQTEIKKQIAAAIAAADERIAARAAESVSKIEAIREDAKRQAASLAEDVAGALVGRFGPPNVAQGAINSAVASEIDRRFGG